MSDYAELTELPAFEKARWSEDGMEVLNEDVVKWSGDNPPPAIGTEVEALFNNLGRGKVVGYFVEYKWLGVLVQFLDPPGWYKRQNGSKPGHVFGMELR